MLTLVSLLVYVDCIYVCLFFIFMINTLQIKEIAIVKYIIIGKGFVFSDPTNNLLIFWDYKILYMEIMKLF